jgi:hypothetical protein
MLYKMLRDGAAGGRAGHSGSRKHRSDPECLRPESVGAWHVEPAAAVDGVNRAPRRVNVAATATHTRVRKGAAGESRYSAIHPEIRQCRIEGLRPPLTSPPASFLLRKKVVVNQPSTTSPPCAASVVQEHDIGIGMLSENAEGLAVGRELELVNLVGLKVGDLAAARTIEWLEP